MLWYLVAMDMSTLLNSILMKQADAHLIATFIYCLTTPHTVRNHVLMAMSVDIEALPRLSKQIVPYKNDYGKSRRSFASSIHSTKGFILPSIETADTLTEDRSSRTPSEGSSEDNLPIVPPLTLVWRRTCSLDKKATMVKKKKKIFQVHRQRMSCFPLQSNQSIIRLPSRLLRELTAQTESTEEDIPIIVSVTNNLKSAITYTLYDVNSSDKRFQIKKSLPSVEGAVVSYAMPIYFQRLYDVGQCHTIEPNPSSNKREIPALKDATAKMRIDNVMRLLCCEELISKDCPRSLVQQLTDTVKRKVKVPKYHVRGMDLFPPDLRKELENIKEEFYKPSVLNRPSEKKVVTKYNCNFKDTFAINGGSILIELEEEMPSYRYFYKLIINDHIKSVVIPQSLVTETDEAKLDEIISQMTSKLAKNRFKPCEDARLAMMKLIGASEFNHDLLMRMIHQINWLDNIFSCLQSVYRTVREEACIVICFMSQNFPLMREINLHRVYDIFHDFIDFTVRTTELIPSSFPQFYVALCYLMNYCPSPSIIEPLIERLTYLQKSELKQCWPRLIHFAYKYWPDVTLGLTNEYLLHRLLYRLELSLRHSEGRGKDVRLALYNFAKRTQIHSPLFTLYLGNESMKGISID